MKKYKVTLHLMVDPTVNDKTFKRKYTVEAENDFDAYIAAGKLQSEDEESVRYRTIFDYSVKEI